MNPNIKATALRYTKYGPKWKTLTEAKYNSFIAGAEDFIKHSGADEMADALDGLIKDIRNKPNDTRYATHVKIAKEALAKYLSFTKKEENGK